MSGPKKKNHKSKEMAHFWGEKIILAIRGPQKYSVFGKAVIAKRGPQRDNIFDKAMIDNVYTCLDLRGHQRDNEFGHKLKIELTLG